MSVVHLITKPFYIKIFYRKYLYRDLLDMSYTSDTNSKFFIRWMIGNEVHDRHRQSLNLKKNQNWLSQLTSIQKILTFLQAKSHNNTAILVPALSKAYLLQRPIKVCSATNILTSQQAGWTIALVKLTRLYFIYDSIMFFSIICLTGFCNNTRHKQNYHDIAWLMVFSLIYQLFSSIMEL